MSFAAQGQYNGPAAEGLLGPPLHDLTPREILALATAFLNSQGVPRETIQRAFRVDRKTVFNRIKRANGLAADHRLRTEGIPPDLE